MRTWVVACFTICTAMLASAAPLAAQTGEGFQVERYGVNRRKE